MGRASARHSGHISSFSPSALKFEHIATRALSHRVGTSASCRYHDSAEHPDTLISMHKLTFTWKEQGRVAEAIELVEGCGQELVPTFEPFFEGYMHLVLQMTCNQVELISAVIMR